jgi:hypothetical protein
VEADSTIEVPGQRTALTGLSGSCPPVGVRTGGRTSGWDIGFEHSLKIARGSSPCCFVVKHHGLVVDASFDWNPVECTEEWGDMGELGKVEH